MSKQSEEKLEELILYHKKKYYDGEPEISDAAYDELERELKEINPLNPVLYIVGTPQGGKIPHDPPMLSSDKSTNLEDIMKWINKIDSKSLSVGYKVDGFSLSLIYNGGYLRQASTRGNGYFGDDVTPAIMKVSAIPKLIPINDKVDIRGELYMPISEFNRINKELSTDDRFSSPRNLAVGTLKQKDLTNISSRILHFKAFDIIGTFEDQTINTISSTLSEWEFDIADIDFIDGSDSKIVEDVFAKVESARENLDFEIDGVIFKYNLPEDRLQAGSTEHHPKWQIAWKFKSRGGITTLNEITWQVGRTGVLTPVGEIEPVEVSGAKLSRVTLHNADILTELDVSPGDEVMVERAGDVIPKIKEVITKSGNNYQFPISCPSCKSSLKKEGVNLVCTGEECRDRDIQQIIHFVRTVEIENLGIRSIEKLYDYELIRSFPDLYKLTNLRLKDVLGKNGEKAYESIQDKKSLPFSSFLASLGVTMLGKKMGKVLASHFNSIEELRNGTPEMLVEIEGISDLTASYIVGGLSKNPRIEDLLKNGVQIQYPNSNRRSKTSKKKPTNSLMSFFGDDDDSDQVDDEETIETKESQETLGKVYVTGKVEGMKKKDLQQFVESHNYEWSTSVSGQLTYLVTGENAGQAKIDKAQKVGIKILKWDEFKNLAE